MPFSKLRCFSLYLPTDFHIKLSYSLLILLTRVVHTDTVLIVPWRWSQYLFRVSAHRRNNAIIIWSKKSFSIHKSQGILRTSELYIYFSIYSCFFFISMKVKSMGISLRRKKTGLVLFPYLSAHVAGVVSWFQVLHLLTLASIQYYAMKSFLLSIMVANTSDTNIYRFSCW
jgi:hypothetical protein